MVTRLFPLFTEAQLESGKWVQRDGQSKIYGTGPRDSAVRPTGRKMEPQNTQRASVPLS
jgi:hypothetical protein